MSNPGLETSGPYASIAVKYVADDQENPFSCSIDTETASRVDVATDGTIRISWQQEDQQAQLDFTLTSSPDNAFFDGFLLGRSGGDIPIEGPKLLSYSVEARAIRRTLYVTLNRGQGTYTYLLYVTHPTKDGAKTGQTDPKIYNEGDGGGGGHR
jgi:hypothetical protein